MLIFANHAEDWLNSR